MLLWKLHTLDYRIASVRYRALSPMLALARRGYRSGICKSLGVDQLRNVEVVIFVKSFTLKDLLFAQRVRDAGIPVALDLCDNLFVPNYAVGYSVSPAEVIQVMARYAEVITTTGDALAEVLNNRLEVSVPIMTVFDGIEQKGLCRIGRRMLKRAQWKELWRVAVNLGFWIRVLRKLKGGVATRARRWWAQNVSQCFLRTSRSSDVEQFLRTSARGSVENAGERTHGKTLIWFGHAGGEYGRFGLPDLVDIASSLEQLARRIKFTLLVVSNNREAYQALVQPLPFETQYVEWDSELIRDLIKASDVTIIPNSRDPFAICKSANRAVLSLSLGVPVVASRTPAMEVLADCVIFDDWAEGLFRYLTDRALVRQHLETAQRVVEREFGPDRIADQWENVLHQIRVSPRPVKSRLSKERVQTVAVVINLAQDFDLALGVLREAARWRGIRLQAWVSLPLLESSPRVWKGLRAHDIDFRILDDQTDADLNFRGIGGLITIAETNQSTHRFSHRIAMLANKEGIPTYTMQHGFENIGLTYSDNRYPIERISFASKTIFTWSPLNLLHPGVPSETRERCIPVGCSKDVPTGKIGLPLPVNRRLVVGIFENLHWERYDRRYAERFVQDTQSLAERFPEIVFLIKPHHTGRWLTSRYEGSVPSLSNLVIADPAHPEWEQFTASQLVNSLDGIITTPSTVAVDAARAGKPVAVVGYDLDVSVYSPLLILGETEDWVGFVDNLQDPALVQRSADFVSRAVCRGNASASILCKIAEDMGIKAACMDQTEIVAEADVDRLQKVL